MKKSEIDEAKEVLRIHPRPKNVITNLQLLSVKALKRDARLSMLIDSIMMEEIARDPDSFKDAYGFELFKPSSTQTLND